MNESLPSSDASEAPAPGWRPLGHQHRRVLGVLIEKAKTTAKTSPGSYPLSLNAVATGCNQKSNRSPQMQIDPEDCEVLLEELREMGAVGVIEGSGRVNKYRHYAYEWFGIDKFELAVLAELLLRGEQTIGELRGRAARMEKIPDVAALRPILAALQAKRLLLTLTPPGRGQVVTHALYESHEMSRLLGKAGRTLEQAQGGEFSGAGEPAPPRPSAPTHYDDPPPAAPVGSSPPASSPPAAAAPPTPMELPVVHEAAPPPPPAVTRDMFSELQVDVAELQAEVARLRDQLRQLEDLIR